MNKDYCSLAIFRFGAPICSAVAAALLAQGAIVHAQHQQPSVSRDAATDLDSVAVLDAAARNHPEVRAEMASLRPVARLFAAYPKTQILHQFMLWHLVGARKKQSREGTVLMVTRFKDDTGRSAYQYHIRSKGRITIDHEMYSWAEQGADLHRLTPERVASLRKLLKHLPPSAPPKSMKDLLIVTCATSNGTKKGYVTRLYDARSVPANLAKAWLFWRDGSSSGPFNRGTKPFPPPPN